MIRKVWTGLAGATFAATMGVAAHAGELNSQAATPSIIGSLDVASYSTLTPETMSRTVGTAAASADATSTAANLTGGPATTSTITSTSAIEIPGMGGMPGSQGASSSSSSRASTRGP